MITFGKQKKDHDHVDVFYSDAFVGFKPLDSDKICLERCPICKMENYASCVTSGFCYNCKFSINVEFALENIAKKHLFLETLKTRNSDSLDFKDQSVWGIRSALYDAYTAGMMHAANMCSK
jgi:hypothetical protein